MKKARKPIDVTVVGKVTNVRLLHPVNASLSTMVSRGTVSSGPVSTVTFSKLEQLLKAWLPILSNESGNAMEVSPDSLNANFAIFVKFVPKVTVRSWLQK